MAARYINWITALLALVTFVAVLSGIHEMQLAEGVDLYWAMRIGVERQISDIIVSACAAVLLFLLVFLPCMTLRHKSVGAFFRLLTVFVAFMPRLSMSYLIHLVDAGGRGADFEWILSVLGLQLPFACLLLFGVGCFEKPWKKWYGVLGLMALLSGIWALWETQGPGFLFVYLLLLICFDAWERLLTICPRLSNYSWILFGGLWLRAVYCIILLRSLY